MPLGRQLRDGLTDAKERADAVHVVRDFLNTVWKLRRVRDEVALLIAPAGLLAVAVLGVVTLAERPAV